jgi:hypothetical protein
LRTTLILAAIAALAFTPVADAKSCKDASGKFIKCPSAAAAQTGAKAATAADTKAAKANAKAAKTDAATAKKADKKAKAAASKVTPAVTTNAPAPAQAAAGGMTSNGHQCKKGKPCGKSCIAVDKVCHK